MDKQQALQMVEWLIRHNIPVSPQYARSLYEASGKPIPEHLQESYAQKKLAESFERAILEGE